jgi:hypothetical protein
MNKTPSFRKILLSFTAGFFALAPMGFSALDMIDDGHMFAVPGMEGDLTDFDWTLLPQVKLEEGVVFQGRQGLSAFNLHPYITRFNGRYFAMWSCGIASEDMPYQHVRYATSKDGLTWGESDFLVAPDRRWTMRYLARGFWIRNGELLALASHDESVSIRDGEPHKGKYFGASLELLYFRWSAETQSWEEGGTVAPNAINNFPPKQLPSGEWMMSRRDREMDKSLLIGGVSAIDEWQVVEITQPVDGHRLDEPYWWELSDGTIAALFRDGSRSRRLYRAFSRDNGRSWTPPIRTDFPDALSKFNALRTSNGYYVLVNNPNRSGLRNPLCISVSRDGRMFTKMARIRSAETEPRLRESKRARGYQYPQVAEFDGHLFVIYSKNKEDIEIVRIPLEEVALLAGD